MRFIRRNWRNADEVGDIRQDIYVSVLRGASRELPDNAGAYLFKVARNALISRSRRAKLVSFELMAAADSQRWGAFEFEADDNLHARAELRRAEEGLKQLPPKCREIVRLRKVEGFSTQETAIHLGISIHTVERQLTLGMRALTDFMLGGTGKIQRDAQSVRKWNINK